MSCNCNNRQPELSLVTQEYLRCFEEILRDMIREMTAVCPGTGVSQTFILQMIPHHMAAIKMSENILRYTTCIPLQEIAQNIVKEQTCGIEEMKKALRSCSRYGNPPQEIRIYQNQFRDISQTMFQEMKNACTGNDVNENFMHEMIPHHRGAVRMSENALRFRICPELTPILKNIIRTQEEGIQEMECLLKEEKC